MSEGAGKRNFDRFLAALDRDRSAAGLQYEQLRTRLIRFFGWEGCRNPERWADEVLDRVAQRIGEGEAVQNVPAYASGVARLVLREALRSEQKEEALEDRVFAAKGAEDPDHERRAQALEECLSALPSRSRSLILQYYQGDAQARIRNRQKLAGEEGVSLNSLRNRALRLREKLEECVRDRLERDSSRAGRTKKKGTQSE